MWIPHNVALLHVAILLEKIRNLLFRQLRVNAGDEEIRAWVDRIWAVVPVVMSVATWVISYKIKVILLD